MEVERLAAGFLDVAVESMARAIRHVSVREGHDPAEFSLLCYGGAAPQHACRVADSLGIPEILIHPLAGVLSAWGIGLADRRLMRRQSFEQPLTSGSHAAIEAQLAEMAAPLVKAMLAQGAASAEVRVRRALEIRAPGTETALEVAQAPLDEVIEVLPWRVQAPFRIRSAGGSAAGRNPARRGRRRRRKDARSRSPMRSRQP